MMKKNKKRFMAMTLAAVMCVPSAGTAAFAAGTEGEPEVKERYHFAEDFTGGTQGADWYHEYKFTSGSDKEKRFLYEEWVQDWNCWIALDGVLTSGMEADMGLIAPAPTADSLATWKAPKDGVAEVSMAHMTYLRRQHQTSGNLGIYIEKNGEKIYPHSGEMLIQAQSKLYLNPIRVQVQEGDKISFGLTSKKNITDTSTYITPVISYVEEEADNKENLAVGAVLSASSTASGYSANGLADYNVSSQHKQYEWKADSADGEWIRTEFAEPADVSKIVFVDGSEEAYAGDILCTFSEGTPIAVTSEQISVRDGIHTITLENPVRTSSVQMGFVNNNGQTPSIGDIQILGEGVEPEGPEQAEAAVYYVDAETGADTNDGKGEQSAWASLNKVNSMQFAPGSKILFKAGTTYRGALILKGSGTQEEPIIVDQYGEGDKPHIEGEGKVRHTLHLKNVNHVTVQNLEITNNAETRALRTGVTVEASGCGIMENVHLKSLDIHDVYGTLDEKTAPNGGIYYVVTDESNDTRFDNISVQDCTVKRVSRTGISMGMTSSYPKWDGHGGIIPEEIKEKYGHTNMIIRNNYVEEAGGDAIVPMFSLSPVIEYNISNKASLNTKDAWTMYNAAIWPWRCEDAVFQFNEAYDTYENGDGQAYDCDYSRNTTYQYNYSHDNKGGFMLVCQAESLDSVIRYNVSQNDHDSLFLMSNPDNADVYNNTFYIGPNLKKVVDLGGKATLRNNIFYCPEGIDLPNNSWGSGFTYDTNLFYGFDTTPNDPNKIVADPMFTDPGKGGAGTEPGKPALDTLSGYALQKKSPAINTGIRIEGNGGRDFAGNPVGETKPDLGAFESDVKPLLTLAQEEITVTDAKESVKVEAVVKEGSVLEGVLTYTSSDENIAAADENGNITFYGYGTAVILVSAHIDGEEVSQKCKITLKERELENFKGQFTSVYSNTADIENPAGMIIDGNASTFWHTAWQGEGFEVSEENPAIVTLELKGDAEEYNGFRFLQRSSNINGVVEKFQYVTGNSFDEASNQITDGVESEVVTVENPSNATWVNVDLTGKENSKYIQIKILSGKNEFGCIAEAETFNQIIYATAENNLVLIGNKLKKAEKELAEALKKVEDLTEEAAGNAELAEMLQKALDEANEAAKKAQEAQKELQEALELVEEEKEEAEIELEKAKAEAEKAKAEAEKAKQEAETAKADKEKAQAEAEKAQAEAEKAQAEAEKARAEAEKAEAEARRASEEAKKAQAEADRIKAENEVSRLEKEKALAEAVKLQKELEELKKAQEDQKQVLKKGDSITFQNVTYKVLDASKGTMTAVRGRDVPVLTIAGTIKIKGMTCQVTQIADKAFRKAKKLKKVTIGKNVQNIGKQAFYAAVNLKDIRIKSIKLETVGKQAFLRIDSKARISVPKGRKASYAKVLKGKITKKAVIK